MNNKNSNKQTKEPGTLIDKIHFEVLEINAKEKFGKYISNEGDYEYDFNFKDLEEAEAFYIALVKEALENKTFNTKAITEIGNEILANF